MIGIGRSALHAPQAASWGGHAFLLQTLGSNMSALIMKCVFTVSLCSFIVAVSAASPALRAQVISPTDEEVKQKLSELDPTNDAAKRLAVFRWLNGHAQSKNKSLRLALPVLERYAREDLVTRVRGEALLSLGIIAGALEKPCPLVIFEALLDKEEEVRMMAAGGASYCKIFLPGTVPVLLRCMQSKNAQTRSDALTFLGRVDKADPKVWEAIEKAKRDKSSVVRNVAHAVHLEATDRLEDYLRFIILISADPESVLPPLPEEKEAQGREKAQRDLYILGAMVKASEWSEKRPDDLAKALMRMLEDPSAPLRRGAIAWIGTFSQKGGGFTRRSLVDGKEVDIPPSLEKSEAGLRFDKLNIEARLREIRTRDSDETVREAAAKTLERLQRLAKPK